MATTAHAPIHFPQVALALAIALAVAGCNRPAPDDAAVPPATTALPPADAVPPPMETTTALPPATTAMGTSATAMMPAGTSTAAMTPATGAATLNDADKAFLTNAGRSNEEEIATTELGMRQGSAKAKELSQMLNADHVALRAQVAAIAPNMPAPSPGKPPASLSNIKATGDAFDSRLYATYIDQHQAAIRTFTDASKNMSLSEPVRGLATNTLPKLQQHLQAVKDAQRAQ